MHRQDDGKSSGDSTAIAFRSAQGDILDRIERIARLIPIEVPRFFLDHRSDRRHIEVGEQKILAGVEVFVAHIAPADDHALAVGGKRLVSILRESRNVWKKISNCSHCTQGVQRCSRYELMTSDDRLQ